MPSQPRRVRVQVPVPGTCTNTSTGTYVWEDIFLNENRQKTTYEFAGEAFRSTNFLLAGASDT